MTLSLSAPATTVLTSAAYLAKAGKKVLVLERRHVLGGAAVTEEIYPGFKYSVCSYVVSLLRPEVIRDLELPKYDLEIIPLDSTLTPMPDGNYLFRCGDHARTRREIARHSVPDAEAYEVYGQLMVQMAMAVKPLLGMIPPEPTTWNPKDLFGLARVGNHFRGLGEKLLYDLTKLMTMSSADFLDEWFETDVLKATMSASGIIGTFMGPRSPGTAYVLLHHYMGELDGAFRSWGFARGGMGTISRVIAEAALHHGAEIRTQAAVDQVLIKNGRAYGVVLASGEEIQSKVVVSGVDPKRTFLKMVDGRHLDPEFTKQVSNFKIRGSSAKVNLALDALPNFISMPGDGPHLAGAVSISPSLDYIERAYDDAKYGDYSRRPYMDIILPSMLDPSMAPPGKHVMSIFVQYAPYHLKNGTWPEKREALGDTVIDTLSEYAPNLKNIILHRQVVTPLGSRAGIRPHRGQYFSGRIDIGPALLSPPRAGLGEISHADQKSLHVRRLHPSGRRRDGGVGTACSVGNSQRYETEVDLACRGHLRRDHHRRRPQRACDRRLSRQRGKESLGVGATPNCRWHCGHGRNISGI